MSNKKNRAFDKSKWPNWIDPNEVIPYDKNAKLHDERQVRNVANSIRRFGWQQDTVITRDNVLVIGHCRRLAALQLGCMLPYHVIDKDADELTDEDIKELRLADNLTNESPWDYVLGALDMADLSFEGFEFDLSEFVADEEETVEDDNSRVERITVKCREQNPLGPYVEAERDFIRQRQKNHEDRNKRRRLSDGKRTESAS